MCPAASPFWSLWTTKPTIYLQRGTSFTDYVSNFSFPEYVYVLLILFALCHKCRPFFLIHTAKNLTQTNFRCCRRISQLLKYPMFLFLTNEAMFCSNLFGLLLSRLLSPFPWVCHFCVSLHCLLLLHFNKCTACSLFLLKLHYNQHEQADWYLHLDRELSFHHLFFSFQTCISNFSSFFPLRFAKKSPYTFANLLCYLTSKSLFQCYYIVSFSFSIRLISSSVSIRAPETFPFCSH